MSLNSLSVICSFLSVSEMKNLQATGKFFHNSISDIARKLRNIFEESIKSYYFLPKYSTELISATEKNLSGIIVRKNDLAELNAFNVPPQIITDLYTIFF